MDTYSDLQMQSPNINQERLDALKKLFPDLFTLEGKLNPAELEKLVDPKSVNEVERYDFRWFGKSSAKREAFTPADATLVFDPKRSVNATHAQNIIIEGENLRVLKLLTSAYRDQVKCIYIDPPYNTGKDFVYSDDFSQNKDDYLKEAGYVENGLMVDTNAESEGRYHSNWLNMIYSRLLMARTLLKPDGVIFVSIDDNEVHHLRKLMDEVFGEENFVAQITVQSNSRGRQSEQFLASVHEYLMLYAKDINECVLLGAALTQEQLKEFKYQDEQSKLYRLLGLRQRGSASRREDRPNMFYPIYVNPNNRKVLLEKRADHKIEVLPRKSTGEEGRWMWSKTKVEKNLDDIEAREISGRNEWDIFVRDPLDLDDGNERTRKFKTIWNEKEINYQNGTQEVKALLDAGVVEFPKPVSLIKKIIAMADGLDEIYLDFFSGSGTTGQAVMELNEEDGGNRKFILVQLPETTGEKSEARKAGYKKISDITIERNKRVVEKMEAARKDEQPKLIEGEQIKQALGFKVFRLAPSNFPRVEWAPDTEKSDEENIAGLRAYIAAKEQSLLILYSRDEMLYEVLLKKEGLSLNMSWRKLAEFTENEVFEANDPESNKRVWVCVDSEIKMATMEYFKTHKDTKFICLERALNTTVKWNLYHSLDEKFKAY